MNKDYIEETSADDFFTNTRNLLSGCTQMLDDIERIPAIRGALSSCETIAETKAIFKANRDFFKRLPDAFVLVEKAQIRIRREQNKAMDRLKQLN